MFGKRRLGRARLGDSKHAIDEIGPGGRKTGCRLISFKKRGGGRVEVVRCAKNKGALSRAAKRRKRQTCWNAKGLFTSCSRPGARKTAPKGKRRRK